VNIQNAFLLLEDTAGQWHRQ